MLCSVVSSPQLLRVCYILQREAIPRSDGEASAMSGDAQVTVAFPIEAEAADKTVKTQR